MKEFVNNVGAQKVNAPTTANTVTEKFQVRFEDASFVDQQKLITVGNQDFAIAL